MSCRKKERERMNKIWARVFDNNYHKSLDHRSFYFKQAIRLFSAWWMVLPPSAIPQNANLHSFGN